MAERRNFSVISMISRYEFKLLKSEDAIRRAARRKGKKKQPQIPGLRDDSDRDSLMPQMHHRQRRDGTRRGRINPPKLGQPVLTSGVIPAIKVHVIETHFMTASLPNFGLAELQPQSSGCSGRR